MFTDQLYYTLKRLNKSERSRYKVDLYWILLGCAQHNNRSVLPRSAQATQMGYPTRTSSKHPTLGPKGINATQDIPTVPPEAHSASSKPRTRHKSSPEPVLKLQNTLRRGTLLGIARPKWLKVLESERRQLWLEEMVRKDLVVRDIDSYAKSV